MAAHWYTRAGVLVEGAGLRRARQDGLLPSVTTVQDIVGKPGLMNWVEAEGIKAALASPLKEGEHIDDAVRRIKEERFQSGRKVTDLGTMVHAELERVIGDWENREAAMPPPPMRSLVEPVIRWIEATYPRIQQIVAEQRVTHNYGYAGTADCLIRLGGPYGAVLDFKTQRPKEGKGLRTWPEWVQQLAAYQRALGYFGQDCRCWSIVIDVTSTLEEKHLFHPWPIDSVEHGWKVFETTLNLHQLLNRYDGGWDKHFVNEHGVPIEQPADLQGLL